MTLAEINEIEIIEDYKSDKKIEQIKAQMLAVGIFWPFFALMLFIVLIIKMFEKNGDIR